MRHPAALLCALLLLAGCATAPTAADDRQLAIDVVEAQGSGSSVAVEGVFRRRSGADPAAGVVPVRPRIGVFRHAQPASRPHPWADRIVDDGPLRARGVAAVDAAATACDGTVVHPDGTAR